MPAPFEASPGEGRAVMMRRHWFAVMPPAIAMRPAIVPLPDCRLAGCWSTSELPTRAQARRSMLLHFKSRASSPLTSWSSSSRTPSSNSMTVTSPPKASNALATLYHRQIVSEFGDGCSGSVNKSQVGMFEQLFESRQKVRAVLSIDDAVIEGPGDGCRGLLAELTVRPHPA
jgi:hypothetical protein